MSVKHTCAKIRKGIDEGVYKMIRLLQRHKQGSKFIDTVVITCNKMGKENALQRLKHIEHELTYDMPPGKYIIQCYTGTTQSSLKKNFEIEKSAPLKILESKAGTENKNEPVHDYTNTQESEYMNLDEYKKLINENADLKATNKLLLMEIDALKREIARIDAAPLEDAGSNFGPIVDTLKEFAPGIMGLAEKFLENRDREISLKEKFLNKTTIKKSMPKKSKEEQLLDYFDELLDSDPETANVELDQLEQENPELYDWLIDQLGIEESEEQENEEE